jgi:hypothetical protein
VESETVMEEEKEKEAKLNGNLRMRCWMEIVEIYGTNLECVNGLWME